MTGKNGSEGQINNPYITVRATGPKVSKAEPLKQSAEMRARPEDRFIGFEHLTRREPKLPKSRWVLIILWLVAFAGVLWLSTLPVSVQAQMLFAWSGVLIFAFLARILRSRFGRILVMCLGAFISVRYMVWRSLYTIPDIENLWNFIPGLFLYLCELYAFTMYFLSLFVIIDPIRRKSVALPEDLRLIPTVDVYVPSYNEDVDILKPTLIAARNMDYPEGKMRVYLLDDGGTEEKRHHEDPNIAHQAEIRHEKLKKLCQEIGVVYLTRAQNVKAKAGNINAAFKRTTGDLVAVFDADHVPSKQFLQKTVGHFLKDPKLFLVQTPHFFINPDPLEHNLQTFSQMPSENEMFYAQVQRGLDKWNAAFFCGSAAVLKRSCLEEIDGFEGDTVTEDCETALELHAKGYRSLYVDEPLIAGLQPDSLTHFIGQRSRWAVGMIQIFLLKRPFLKRGLTMAQRFSYLSSNLFWLFSFARLGFIIAPLFYLYFGLEIYDANAWEFAAYTIPHILAATLMGHLLYGGVRWPLISELYEYIQSMFLYRAAISTFLSPRKPTFNVTAKGETKTEDHLSPLTRPFLIMLLLVTGGIFASIYRYFYHPDQMGITLVVGMWNILSFVMVLAGFGVVYERKQMRKTHRMPRKHLVSLTVDGLAIDGTMTDLSLGGAKVNIPSHAIRSQDLANKEITLSGRNPKDDFDQKFTCNVRHVRSQNGLYECGIQFLPQNTAEEEAIISLFYANHDEWTKWQVRRRRKPSAIVGIYFFVKLAFTKGGRGLAFACSEWFGRRKKNTRIVSGSSRPAAAE